MSKLAIIVPYRNRKTQLRKFLHHMKDYMLNFPWIEYEIIVVEQQDRKRFNRGKLLNAGFLVAEGNGAHYVIFHDVDLLPIDGSYQYSDKPLQLANKFEVTDEFRRTIQRDYFGGVTLFPIEDFRKINGYSNKYVGWGFEDNDLLYRCRETGLELEDCIYSTPSFNKQSLYFDGKSSYVKIPNRISFVRPVSFVVSFYPDKIFCNPDLITDEYAIFGIPGYDLNLSFNSFSTYKFELFLVNDVTLSITTEFTPNVPVRVVVTIDPKKRLIELYFNGKKIGNADWDKYHIRKYNVEEFLYLGAAAPGRKEKPKHFKGHIDSFSVFKKTLTRSEVKKLSSNYYDEKPEEIEGLEHLKEDLACSYDSRYIDDNGNLIDLSGNKLTGKLHNVEIKDIKTEGSYNFKMPYRRPCTYKMLKHSEGGYKDGYWVDWRSRENQIYFHSLVEKGLSNLENDGLNNSKYKILDFVSNNNIKTLKIRT